MAYAPEALKWLADEWRKAIPSAVFSGIVGDSAHNSGYHRSANEVPSSDYSRQLEGDRVDVDPNAAAALDMSMNDADIRRITKLFYDSWRDQNDLRLNYTREVIGTLDSRNVIYMDTQSGERGSSDSSHLWHIHVGFLRRFATNFDAARAVLSIVQGKSYAEYLGTDEDEGPREDDDDMGAWTGPFVIPKLAEGGHFTGPINPVRAGAANPRDAWVNIGADTFDKEFYVRAWYSDGKGGWAPFPQSVVPGDSDDQGAGVFKFTNGLVRSFSLPSNTWLVSVKRHPGPEGDTYDGFLAFGVEHGDVVR